jgi:hypothetical protein
VRLQREKAAALLIERVIWERLQRKHEEGDQARAAFWAACKLQTCYVRHCRQKAAAIVIQVLYSLILYSYCTLYTVLILYSLYCTPTVLTVPLLSRRITEAIWAGGRECCRGS